MRVLRSTARSRFGNKNGPEPKAILNNFNFFRGILPISLLFFSSLTAGAQAERFVIPPDQREVDGIALSIHAGDTVFLEAGNRNEVRFLNLTGSEVKPVIVINHSGKVVINSEKRYGISFENSVHFRITGTGSDDRYGIEIASSRSQGLSIGEFSSNCEADHLEIHDVGFAGIMAKTDPDCSRKDLRYFVMKNLSFHDNLIYETGGEGFYIGFSWFPIRPFRCDDDSILYAHEIHGIRIYNNDLRNTHWESIQVGSSTRDVKIYCNSVRNYGSDNELWQNNGVQIGAGTTGDFFNNYINSGTGDAISFFGGGGNRLFNNLIINAGNSAIFHNDREAVKGRNYQIMNNTIIDPAEFGITVISGNTWTNRLYNNIITIKDIDKGIIGYVDSRWYTGNNFVCPAKNEAGFVNPDSGDFHLNADSELLTGGIQVPWLQFDYDFRSRSPETNSIGAFGGRSAVTGMPPFPFVNEDETDMIYGETGSEGKYAFDSDVKNTGFRLYNGSGSSLDRNLVSIKGKKVIIDFSELPKGIYYLASYTSDTRIQLKRIVKR